MSETKAPPKRLKKFQDDWLEVEEFQSWLKRVPNDDSKYRCSVCKKSNSLSSSGRGALVDHLRASKHIEAVEKLKKMKTFFQPPPSVQQKKINELKTLSEDDKVKAQIIWLMKSLDSGFSNHASDDVGDVLRRMDPKSEILAAFNMKETKAAYVVNYGLAPYYRGVLYEEMVVTDIIVLSFDESHNDAVHKGEMVLMVRYWCKAEKTVKVRYLDSVFIGHAAEKDLLAHFNSLSSKLERSKIYHVSMDGPKVNHNFLRSLKRDWENGMLHKLLDIGTCNLHIVSGAFKTGAEKSGWEIHKTLKSSYQMFHEAPVRREDYTLVTGSEKFPKFFSATRWVENQEPADHLIKIWPNIQKLWTWWSNQKPRSKQPCNLENKTMLHMKDALNDNLRTTKLHFFSFIAGKLQVYLIKYQSDKPLIPFLHRDLMGLLRSLLTLIIKKDIVDAAKTGAKVKSIDLYNKDNLVKLSHVDIGFAAEHTVKNLLQQDAATSHQVKEFRKGCIGFVRNILLKILERSPIEHLFLKYTAVFDPANLVSVPKEKLNKILKALLTELANLKIIDISKGDKVLQEFSKFYDKERTVNLQSFKDYSEINQRLDTFYFHDLNLVDEDGESDYPNMTFVLRLILTMSHGQSSVERDFSLKNNLERENQSEKTIVSRRICKDYMAANKVTPSNLVVDKKLLLSVKAARRRYQEHLDEEAKKKKPVEETMEQIAKKRKQEEIEQIDRDILLFSVGVKEADTAVKEAGKALETFCGKKRTDKEVLLSINAKISGNLKRKSELEIELEVLKKKKKDLEK